MSKKLTNQQKYEDECRLLFLALLADLKRWRGYPSDLIHEIDREYIIGRCKEEYENEMEALKKKYKIKERPYDPEVVG